MSYVYRGVELPAHIKESIDAYVDHGRPTGDFLRAVVENNLTEALSYADETSLAALSAVVSYFHWETPIDCWGRKGAWENWIKWKQRKTATTNKEK